MDDEKSLPEKLTDAISKAAHSVKSAVSHVIDTASDAAQHAMEANAEKISRIPAAKADPEQVAGTTNEQIYIPEASDAAAMPMPLVPVAAAPKKRTSPAKPAPVMKAAVKTKPASKPANRKASVKKAATKSAKKAGKKKSELKKTRKPAMKSNVRSPRKGKRKSSK